MSLSALRLCFAPFHPTLFLWIRYLSDFIEGIVALGRMQAFIQVVFCCKYS